MTLAGIILAGGASRRMGSPKALLDFHGETFLDRLIRVFTETCDSLTVVLGHEPEVIVRGIKRTADAQFVHNADYELGQFSSLQCGLRAPGLHSADLIAYTPVDYPAIESSTIRSLRTALTAGEDLLAIPRHESKRGHPILFRSELRREFLKLGVNAQARDVVHRYVDRTCYVDVPDPGILRDVDDRAAYGELLAGSEMRG